MMFQVDYITGRVGEEAGDNSLLYQALHFLITKVLFWKHAILLPIHSPIRDVSQKKRENVGILKKTGGGVYPNPTFFGFSLV